MGRFNGNRMDKDNNWGSICGNSAKFTTRFSGVKVDRIQKCKEQKL